MAAAVAAVKDSQVLLVEAAAAMVLVAVIVELKVVLEEVVAAVPTAEAVLMGKPVQVVDLMVTMVAIVVLAAVIRVDLLLLKVDQV